MNTIDFTYLLEHPNEITSVQTTELEKILHEFPYLQPARAIYLKGLFNQNSYRYNTELKLTAAYTTNRTILFHFITSKLFKTVSTSQANTEIDNTNEVDDKIQIEQTDTKEENKSLEKSIIKSIHQADTHFRKNIINWEPTIHMIEPEQPADFIDKAQNLNEHETNKLVEFDRNESHSFSQWLQLTKMKPIDRSNDEKISGENTEEDKIQNKFELIDKFIEANPKIGTAKVIPPPMNIEKSNQENTHLMTETLAKIYLQQKKYQKAIQAYEILILKYPEKSSLFAERIIEIKKIQNNNN